MLHGCRPACSRRKAQRREMTKCSTMRASNNIPHSAAMSYGPSDLVAEAHSNVTRNVGCHRSQQRPPDGHILNQPGHAVCRRNAILLTAVRCMFTFFNSSCSVPREHHPRRRCIALLRQLRGDRCGDRPGHPSNYDSQHHRQQHPFCCSDARFTPLWNSVLIHAHQPRRHIPLTPAVSLLSLAQNPKRQ